MKIRMCVWLLFVLLGCLAGLAQSSSAQAAASSKGGGAGEWDRSFLISPSLAWITTTQDQTQEGGMTLLSFVKSRSFCDEKTKQFGVLGSASDSSTSSSSGPNTVLESNDVHADALFGIGLRHSDGPERIEVTKNYVSGYADIYTNNSVGIGLQQEYAINYQRYLTPCVSVLKHQRFFSSVTAGIGFVDQRLYNTIPRTDSAVIPVSAQVSYVVSSVGQAPKLIVSGQAGYTPLLSDMHAYQAYANASVQIPTQFPFLTVSLNEMDLYMNNAPSGFKRNYQSGSIQLTFSFGRSTNTNARYPGACYTADTLSHLFCYDQVAASECSPPSVFRPGARCSIVR